MNKYFNTDEDAEGIRSMSTLRIVETDGFQVVEGGYKNAKGKLMQYNVIAYCETKEEAETLIRKLCEL